MNPSIHGFHSERPVKGRRRSDDHNIGLLLGDCLGEGGIAWRAIFKRFVRRCYPWISNCDKLGFR